MLITLVECKDQKGNRYQGIRKTTETTSRDYFIEMLDFDLKRKGLTPIRYLFPKNKDIDVLRLESFIAGKRTLILDDFYIYE